MAENRSFTTRRTIIYCVSRSLHDIVPVNKEKLYPINFMFTVITREKCG